MRMPRLSFGKLVHISSSLMTLLLAMNMHALAGHLKDNSTQKTAQPVVNETQVQEGAPERCAASRYRVYPSAPACQHQGRQERDRGVDSTPSVG